MVKREENADGTGKAALCQLKIRRIALNRAHTCQAVKGLVYCIFDFLENKKQTIGFDFVN